LIPCDYVPLEFEELDPIWSNLVIDSTIIGHHDSCGEYVQDYSDGMFHLFFDMGSFVTNEHLYAITEGQYDNDFGNFFIQKVDLASGEQLWSKVIDLRTESHRMKVLHATEVEDKLHLYGVRAQRPDSKGDGPVEFSLTFSGLNYHFHRIYDANDGRLLNETSPTDGDSTAAVIHCGPFINSQFYLDDKIENIQTHRYFLADNRTHFLLRRNIDTSGYLISEYDTMAIGHYNNIPNDDYHINDGRRVVRNESGHYIHLQSYSPKTPSAQDFRAYITEMDENLQVIKMKDLSANGLQLQTLTDSLIFLSGAYSRWSLDPDRFYIILDRDFNLIKKIEAKENGQLIGAHPYIMDSNGKIYMTGVDYKEEGQSRLFFYQDEGEGVRKIQTLTIKQSEWVAFAQRLIVLDNGDLLMKIIHSCYVEGSRESNHGEWMRFAIDELEGPSDAVEVVSERDGLSLSPNPASNLLTVSLEERFEGEIMIIDVMGRTLLHRHATFKGSTQLDIEDLSEGSYQLTLVDHKGMVRGQRFIKI